MWGLGGRTPVTDDGEGTVSESEELGKEVFGPGVTPTYRREENWKDGDPPPDRPDGESG